MNYHGDHVYADTRLSGTFVIAPKLKQFVQVTRVEEDAVKCLDLSRRVVYLDVNELEITNFNLGYLNKNGRAHYLARIPKRRDWKQGLRCGVVRILSGNRENPIGMSDEDFHQFINLLLDPMPSFEEALIRAPEVSDIAFHKDWAVHGGKYLMYRGCVAGTIDKEGKPAFNKKYVYLQEAFQEALNDSSGAI